jgi:fructokinase
MGVVPGVKVKAVDTTGAGDGFVAGLLKGLHERPEAFADERLLQDVCLFANVVGAITTTQRGAIPALPSSQEVDEFVKDRNLDIPFA